VVVEGRGVAMPQELLGLVAAAELVLAALSTNSGAMN
jgi:hypothetical protein